MSESLADVDLAELLGDADLDVLLRAVVKRIGHRTVTSENKWELALVSVIEGRTERTPDPTNRRWLAISHMANAWGRDAAPGDPDEVTDRMMGHLVELVEHIDGADSEVLEGGSRYDEPEGRGVTVWRLARLVEAHEAVGQDIHELGHRLVSREA